MQKQFLLNVFITDQNGDRFDVGTAAPGAACDKLVARLEAAFEKWQNADYPEPKGPFASVVPHFEGCDVYAENADGDRWVLEDEWVRVNF